MFGINGWEFILLIVLAVVILGPERLPEYAAKLARGIHKARIMAEGAKTQLKDQLGPEYQDLNWRQYDPRQYDPRRIVKQALLDPIDEIMKIDQPQAAPPNPEPAAVQPGGWDPNRPTPYDVDAT